MEPSDDIAVQEQPLILYCQVEGIQPITITWRKNGVMIVDSENAFMLANGSLYVSRFQRVRGDGSSDEGEYDCMAQNHYGLVVSRKAKIQAASKFMGIVPPVPHGAIPRRALALLGSGRAAWRVLGVQGGRIKEGKEKKRTWS